MHISKKIFEKVVSTQGAFVEKLSKISAEKTARDFLSFEKPKEQIEIIRKYYPNLEGKRLLEIGSGLGVFNLVSRTVFGIDAWGVEPGGEGYGGSLKISHDILEENNLSADHILDAKGEHLPFENSSFDIVFSTTVLEHVESPETVISEAIRVCKKGGIIQIAVPSYGSFFDGHYACFYLPYQPKWLWKIYLKYVLHRPVHFVNELRTEINYFSVRRWVKPHEASGTVSILSMGDEIFRERMRTADFSDWAGLGKVKTAVNILRALRISSLVA